MSHTFSFNALRNPLVSTILTKEFFGYKDAETSGNTRIRANIDRLNSRILSGGNVDIRPISNESIQRKVLTWLAVCCFAEGGRIPGTGILM
jgi:hypothetical protein